MKIITINEEFYTNKTFAYWNNILERYGFLETCRGFLVNLKKIKMLDKRDCIMINDIYIPISKRKRTYFLKKLTKIMKFL